MCRLVLPLRYLPAPGCGPAASWWKLPHWLVQISHWLHTPRSSRRPKDPQELRRSKAVQRTYTLHKLMRNFSLRCSRTTPWRWQISQPPHKLTGHRLRWSQRQYQSYQAWLLTSLQNLQQHKTRTLGLKHWGINQPHLVTDIGRPTTQPRRIQPQSKIKMYTPEVERGSKLTVTAPPTATRWRSLTRLRRIASPVMVTTSQLRD